MRGWTACVWVAGALAGSCTTNQLNADEHYYDEWPMTLTLSDGATYGAQGSIAVDTLFDPPDFALYVLAVPAAGEIEAPRLQASIAPSDLALVTSHAASGGVDVPYGDPRVPFSYYVDGVEVYRSPRTLRLWIEGATVHVRIEMGEAIPYAGPPPAGLAPTATAELVGHLSIGCVVPTPELGMGFEEGDPTWSSAACRGASETYGLGVLRDLE